MDTGSIGTERNKAVVAEFDKLVGSDDLSPSTGSVGRT